MWWFQVYSLAVYGRSSGARRCILLTALNLVNSGTYSKLTLEFSRPYPVAFNICIGNSDDHFRNHGFLLTAKGWTLSPAYDMNPTLNEYQSLLISNSSSKADLAILSDACEDYMLPQDVATKIISEVVAAVKGWKALATKLGIANSEMDLFGNTFESRIKEYI